MFQVRKHNNEHFIEVKAANVQWIMFIERKTSNSHLAVYWYCKEHNYRSRRIVYGHIKFHSPEQMKHIHAT